MKKKKVLFILGLCFLLILAAGCARTAELDFEEPDSDYWDGENAKYVNVKVNYSAYGIEDQDWDNWMLEDPMFFLGPEQKQQVQPEYFDGEVRLKVPQDTKDLYIVPGEINLIAKGEEWEVPLNQEYPIQTEFFSIKGVQIPELTNWNANRAADNLDEGILLCVYLVSDTKQYPEHATLYYEGKPCPSRGIYSEGDSEESVKFMCYKYVMPDLYTASMVMKFGTLKYSVMKTKVTAEKATYACDDKTITLHVIEE